MNLKHDEERMVFSISAEDVQDFAVSIFNRRLTDYEMRTAEKCIDSGLSFGLDVVLKAAVEVAVEKW